MSQTPPAVRRITRILDRNSQRPSSSSSNGRNLHRHQINQSNQQQAVQQQAQAEPAPIKLRSTGFARQTDGSVTLSVTLDKDQVECCVCLTSMTQKIYRCQGNESKSKKIVCHNICSDCQWQMTRMKAGNGHTKGMQCPICKVKGPFIRNTALERQLLELSTPCVHKSYGCNTRFFPWDDTKDLHEKHLCLYQPCDCPFCHQSIPGGRVNFVEHLVKSVKLKNAQSGNRNSLDLEREEQEIDEEEMADLDEDEEEEELDQIMNEREPVNIDQIAIDGDSEDEDSEFVLHENDDVESEEISEAVSEELEEEKEAPPSSMDQDGDKVSFPEVPPCLLAFYQSESCLDLRNKEKTTVQRQRNEFIVDYNLGIILCFIAPSMDCECWKVYTISISPKHGMGGNSRVYIQYFDDDTMTKFMEKEQSMGLTTNGLFRPVTNTLIMNLGRLHPTSLRKLFKSYPSKNAFVEIQANSESKKLSILSSSNEMKEDIDTDQEMEEMEITEAEIDELEEFRPNKFLGISPCSDIQCGFIYGGNAKYDTKSVINNLSIRVFGLEQSLKVGAVIDARDFTGKWYQAEVVKTQDEEGNQHINLDHEYDDYLQVRRAKIHYLGYSQNYDEWLSVDTDSHRIAQRGTFTVGPDLRAIRRNTTHLQHAANHHNHANNVQQVVQNRNTIERVISRRNRRSRNNINLINAENNNHHEIEQEVDN